MNQKRTRQFDKDAKLPPRLQWRIDAWNQSPPSNQHQIYGPLNSYLQGHKFPPEYFLVKPQGCMRKEAEVGGGGKDVCEIEAWIFSKSDITASASTSSQSQEESQSRGSSETSDSVDSRGIAVTDEKMYPDFMVEQYWPAGTSGVASADIIRVVVEVGQSNGSREKVEAQLRTYMDAVGERWNDLLLGIGILNNKVWMVQMRGNQSAKLEILNRGKWISFFSPELVMQLNEVVDLSMKAENNQDV